MDTQKQIPDYLFQEILCSVPVPSADLVIVRGRGKDKEFLLGKRTERPYRGTWFNPGGKILYGEKTENAARRVFCRELGVSANNSSFQFVDYQDVMNPPGELGVPYHSIWHIFLVRVRANTKFKPNKENAAVKWFREINPRWPACVRKSLLVAGFGYKNKKRAR